jgi:hypothetical protein
VGACLATGCQGLVVVINPSGLLIVSVDSPVVSPAGCSDSGTASVMFEVVVRGAAEDLLLSALTFELADAAQRAHRVVPYQAAEIDGTFGSLLVPAASVRRLRFSVPYDCSPPRPTQLAVHANAITRSGRTVQADAATSLR